MYRSILQKRYWMWFTLISVRWIWGFSLVLPLYIHFWSRNLNLCVHWRLASTNMYCFRLRSFKRLNNFFSLKQQRRISKRRNAIRFFLLRRWHSLFLLFARCPLFSLHSSLSAILLRKAVLIKVRVNHCNAIKGTWHTWMQIFSLCLVMHWR